MPAPRILVAYHSSDGHTTEIATRIAQLFEKSGASVDLVDAAHAPAPTGHDGVVLGDSIHAGRHSRALTRYLTRHVDEIRTMPNALFQVSLTSAKTDEKSAAEVRKYVDQLLEKTGFDPDIVGLFAGAVVYTRYGWLKRRMMRRIMAGAGQDTDTSRDYDYTDWDAVEHFAEHAFRLIAGAGQESEPQIRELVPQTTAQTDVTVAKDRMGEVFGPAYERLMSTLADQGVTPTAPPFARYLDVADDTAWRVTLGVPVATPFEPTDTVYAGELPGVRAAVAVHRGPYDGLPAAWAAAMDWVSREGLAVGGAPWESYVVADMDGTDPQSQRTEIVLPLA